MDNVKILNYERRMESTNDAQLVGTVTEDLVYSHEILGEKFYKSFLEVQRLSGDKDTLPITVSGRLVELNPQAYKKDALCGIFGQLRSYNKMEDGKSRLILEIFVEETMTQQEAEYFKESKLENVLSLKGYLCKVPIHRITPFKREICDVLMAVNRTNSNKSDYIPCIAWGRNAQYMARQDIGERFAIKGRFQSRDYQKTIDGVTVKKTAYEVSIGGLEGWDEATMPSSKQDSSEEAAL